MTASLNMHKVEVALMKEHAFSSALRRFLEFGRGCLLNVPGDEPPLPEAADFEPLAGMLAQAGDAFAGDLTLGLASEDSEIIIPLLAAFNLGDYACEAADRLIDVTDQARDAAMKDVCALSDDIDGLPFGRLIPLNEWRRELLGQIPQENHFLFPWLTECAQFDSDSLERIIQAWDELWDRTATRDDVEALVPVLAAIQSDTALLDHLKAEARFHSSVMKAAGELARQQHMERARRSAGKAPGIMDRIVSWLRMPAVSGAVALVLVAGIFFATQVDKGGRPMPIGVTMEMLVYQDGLTVRGGEEAEPEVRKPADAPLEEGDAIQIRFMLEEAAYVYLFHEQKGAPHEPLFSGRLGKGEHIFPEEGKRIRVIAPSEEEGVALVASREPLSPADLEKALADEADGGAAKATIIHFQF
ncbi:hypothetical protein BerOc1_00515 [Pseudodesulfovibrio hydrargyri]|uniref:DUF4384 domain-containing protein n=1 Tax=Pseudodesulfovibrio hydrargyri TaxID=2125990 RepID=A0A1J5N8T3_9BACT|nr:hypothetical protein [Pseudodesulfovibrio hydrargyri]OIQ52043.1 hypothetical protein BerOc1_00515 [Pseudodesulfovibrio hydrargyri]